ncbi:MAG: hypothetical protein LBM60_06775 [Clostridium sp.]|jgi:hypothetical protein|nr:hypothetical protein [Clostridium sp.]
MTRNKKRSYFFVLPILIMLSGCSLKNAVESGLSPSQAPVDIFTPSKSSSEPSFGDEMIPPEGYTHDWSKISMVTEFTDYPTDVRDIKVFIFNQDAYNFYYDVDAFTLEYYDNEQWVQVAFSEGGDYGNDLAGIIYPGNSANFKADIENRFDLPLTPGKYRIVKNQLTAEFSVTNS